MHKDGLGIPSPFVSMYLEPTIEIKGEGNTAIGNAIVPKKGKMEGNGSK